MRDEHDHFKRLVLGTCVGDFSHLDANNKNSARDQIPTHAKNYCLWEYLCEIHRLGGGVVDPVSVITATQVIYMVAGIVLFVAAQTFKKV